MKALHDEDLEISRLYYTGPNDDPEECAQLRDEARAVATRLLSPAKEK